MSKTTQIHVLFKRIQDKNFQKFGFQNNNNLASKRKILKQKSIRTHGSFKIRAIEHLLTILVGKTRNKIASEKPKLLKFQ